MFIAELVSSRQCHCRLGSFHGPGMHFMAAMAASFHGPGMHFMAAMAAKL